MAKRILRVQHQEEIRAKIRGSQLINLVQDYALTGEYQKKQIEGKRIDAALGLLRKLVPDLASTEIKATVSHWTDAIRKVSQADQQVAPAEDRPAVH